ncbi:GumC family protein [Thermodesulforhabdus norvegica]|uniref:Uncharacterized protein involved in exopolysaccharide biosynthesis n=1 Tax=Thermodesulforhabdus norvegica TaxID=39841 RepID=A0A1I4WCH7_9BACT|nr:Wzz/FepE/Etk N-terminal domain-containing protein [Thermodesulforhabdus norvegica]SFN11022.1 Uncharacterized protein involved in exopolysaccharide biosynthesis [Thermodesulforhabdus norvegica]
MTRKPNSSIDTVEILNILFKNIPLIGLIFFVAVGGALLYCLTTSPVYQAEVKFLVKLGRENIASLSLLPQNPYNVIIQERPENVQDEIEILKSPALTYRLLPELKQKLKELPSRSEKGIIGRLKSGVEPALHKWNQFLTVIGLKSEQNEEEYLFKTLRKALKISWQEESNVITMAFRWNDPEFAAYAVNRYAEEYLKYRAKAISPRSPLKFYEDQIHTYEDLLGQAEEALLSYQTQHDLSNVERQKELLLQERSDLERQLMEINLRVTEISSKEKGIRKMLQSGDEWIETPQMGRLGVQFTDLAPLDEKYFEVKSALDAALQLYTPKAREVRSLKEQIQKLRIQKANSLLNIFGVERTNLEAQRDKLLAQLEQNRQKLSEITAHQVKYEQLVRNKKLLEETYLLYKKKAEELRMAEEMDKWRIANVQIIDRAIPPITPIWPRKKLLIVLVAFLALSTGVLIAFVKELLSSDTVNRISDLEELGLEPLALIPELKRR